MYTVFQGRFRCSASAVPRCIELLHEVGVSFPRAGFPNLLNSHIPSCADNVAQVDEVVTHVPIFCNLGLLAFKTIMEGDDCTRGFVGCRNDGRCAWLDSDVVIVVEAVDLERLVVIGLIVDVDIMHDLGIAGT